MRRGREDKQLRLDRINKSLKSLTNGNSGWKKYILKLRSSRRAVKNNLAKQTEFAMKNIL